MDFRRCYEIDNDRYQCHCHWIPFSCTNSIIIETRVLEIWTAKSEIGYMQYDLDFRSKWKKNTNSFRTKENDASNWYYCLIRLFWTSNSVDKFIANWFQLFIQKSLKMEISIYYSCQTHWNLLTFIRNPAW